MTDSIGFKIIKGILVVVIPLLFILTFAILFLKLAGFNINDEISQISSHLPFISHSTAKTTKTAKTAGGEKVDTSKIIANLQNEVKDANKEIDAKNQKIQSLNAQIKTIEQSNQQEKQATLDAEAKAKANTIAQVYQNMDPAKAAAILSKMKDTDAASYLNMMNNTTKAKILEQMPADVAAKITPLLKGQPETKAS